MHLILFNVDLSTKAPSWTFIEAALRAALGIEPPVQVPLFGERLQEAGGDEFPKKTLYRDAIYEHAQRITKTFSWALYRWNYTYSESLYAFVTTDTGLRDRLIAAVEAQQQSHAWKKRKTLDHLILAHYDGVAHLDETLHGALFFDHEFEGEWAWRQSQLEENPPYLILSADQEETLPQGCVAVARAQTGTLIVSCNNAYAFRTLCGTDQTHDPFGGYIVSGLANPRALLRQLSLSKDGSHLQELRRLGEVAGWAYSWQWGGGDGEFHATFWARDPLVTNNLWQEVMQHSKVMPLARF